MVRIYATGTEGDLFLGMGIVIDAKGTIAIDESSLGDAAPMFVDIGGGAHVSSALLARDSATGLAYLSASTSTVDGKPLSWTPAMLSNKNPGIGETVVLLSGKTATRIATGIITALSPLSEGIKDAIQVLDTSVTKNDILSGSPIMNTEGNILGVSTGASRASSETGFIAAKAIHLPEMKEITKPAP